MNTWKTTVQPTRRSVRLLMTDTERNEVLKAALPRMPQHPRALLTLLESLAQWVGQPLTAAVSAEFSVDRRCAEALFGDGFLPHTRVGRAVTVVASPDTDRVLDGNEEIARHPRSWGKGRTVEDPAHIEALVVHKAKASESRGMPRLFTAVPDARRLIEALAERGGNIGGAVARLGELLDAFGAAELTVAIQEALAADAPHPGAVRQVLDRRRQDTDQPPPIAVTLPDDPRVRNVVVPTRTLHAYDQLAGKHGGHNG